MTQTDPSIATPIAVSPKNSPSRSTSSTKKSQMFYMNSIRAI